MSEPRQPPRDLPATPCLPRSFVWACAGALLIPTLLLPLTVYLSPKLGPWTWFGHSGLIGLAFLVLGVWYHRDKRELAAFLRAHDFRVCPRCRYPLSNLDPKTESDRCPECGTSSQPEKIRKLWENWDESARGSPKKL